MKPIIQEYNSKDTSAISALRTIILFGRNVSTYKFALANTLLKLKPRDIITYEELRDEFLKSILAHYEKNPHQYQSGKNNLTKAFDSYKLDGDWDALMKVAERNIYNNVFDAFHNVGGSEIRKNKILFEHLPNEKKLILTENLNAILEKTDLIESLKEENESRWMIVEEAWKNKLSPNLLIFDQSNSQLISVSPLERTNLRSAVSVLLPYQHGRCFCCNKMININSNSDDGSFPDVDHFLAHSYFKRQELTYINPDGIWNLVIACKECNRGGGGKFDSIPDTYYQQEIIKRNILLTEEHRHSLKNSILLSLNAKNHNEVQVKMLSLFSHFDMIKGWKPKLIYTYE
jgi:hypothetical protein